jgi:hypothetical protein
MGQTPRLWYSITTVGHYLINQLSTIAVALLQNVLPQSGISSMDKIACLMLEHGVFIGNVNELIVTLSLLVTDVCEIRISLFAVFTNETRIIVLINGGKGNINISRHVHQLRHRCNNLLRSPSRKALGCYLYQCRSWPRRCKHPCQCYRH